MKIIEAQLKSGVLVKTECDLCMDQPDNRVLIEKPNSMLVNGQLLLAKRLRSIYICMDCLMLDIEEHAEY